MTGEELGLQMCGSITTASSEASLKGLEELEAAATRFGIPNERIDHKRLKELLPWIEADAVGAASYMPTDAFIDSASLCQGYAHAASQLGVTLKPNCKVAPLVPSPKTKVGLLPVLEVVTLEPATKVPSATTKLRVVVVSSVEMS